MNKELAKKRREYVQTKTQLIVFFILGLCFTAIFGFAAYAAFLFTIGFQNVHLKAIQGVLVLIPACLLCVIGLTYCRSYDRKLTKLPYVPPVAEQIAALPAEEILVRGSDQPTAAPGELLRAADEGTATASRELLRPEVQSTKEDLQQTNGITT